MKNCEQTEGMTVLEHGLMVADYYEDLDEYLNTEHHELKYDWKIPDWVHEYRDYIIYNTHGYNTTYTYQVFHDIGKPFCLHIDEDGTRHFPNHAQVSYDVWMKLWGHQECHREVATLMKMDMDIHLLKDSGVVEFAERTEAMTLLMTGLSEVHSNASMFGGTESTSFKIKWKQINKRGKAIFKYLTENRKV
jgi:hypothetical protein